MQIDEERRRLRDSLFGGCGQAGRTLGQIGTQRFGCGVAERNVTLLLAFAAHEDCFIGPVDVVEIQAHQLCIANAAAVEHLENRLVARRPTCRIVAHCIDHAIHLLDGRHARQMFGQTGSGDKRCRVLLDVPGTSQPLEPATDCCERPCR